MAFGVYKKRHRYALIGASLVLTLILYFAVMTGIPKEPSKDSLVSQNVLLLILFNLLAK